jgi:hypothetical protein
MMHAVAMQEGKVLWEKKGSLEEMQHDANEFMSGWMDEPGNDAAWENDYIAFLLSGGEIAGVIIIAVEVTLIG